jgi:hypothetical protein
LREDQVVSALVLSGAKRQNGELPPLTLKEQRVQLDFLNFFSYTLGICCPKIDNLQVLRISDIKYTTSCCCNECGNITIFSVDPTDPQLSIKGIPHGREVYEKIRDAFNNVTNNARIEVHT